MTERFVVVLITPDDQIRIYSTPEPMDRVTARRFLRDLERTFKSELEYRLHLRRVVELTPGEPFGGR